MDYTKQNSTPIVLGILSIVAGVLFVFAPIGLVLGIIGTITGSRAREKSGDSGMVLSIIGLVISAIVTFIIFNLCIGLALLLI